MDLTTVSKDQSNEVLIAKEQWLNDVNSFIPSMSLKCAIELGIADAIHNHGKPMTLFDLAASLPIHPQKTEFLPQLMRILVHLGYFSYEKILDNENGAYGYDLKLPSQFLLEDHPFSVKPYVLLVLNPLLVNPWIGLSVWFQNDDPTSFYTSNEMPFWECTSYEPQLNKVMKDTMASDSKLLASVLMASHQAQELFKGVNSLVDVGGGLGEMARAIADAYPQIKCVVLDLPHVIEGLEGGVNLSYVAGDMFEDIPPTDAILLKWILHDWSDEYSVKILKQCKKAITSNEFEGQGKVIIIDVVIDEDCQNEEEYNKRKTQLLYDMEMMALFTGKERTKREFEKLFLDAGFTGGFEIFPLLGFRSVIEVYP